MNKYRHMLADAIESNCGYSRGYWDRWAISYEVGLYYADLDLDNIYQVMLKEHGYLPPPTSIEWDEQQVWNTVQEMMVWGLNDDDTNRTYSPDTAKRYGLGYYRYPQKYKRRTNECAFYPAKKEGWIRDDPYICEYFDVKFGLAGRCGKHLVVEEFEGRSLAVSADALAEDIRDDDCGNYSNHWCVRLLAMMDEWESIFTSRNASKEMEYQAAFLLHQELSDQADRWRKALSDARTEKNLRNLAAVQAAVMI